MKVKGINVSINFTTMRSFLRQFKKKKRPEVNDEFELWGRRWRIYDADDEGFKVVEVK